MINYQDFFNFDYLFDSKLSIKISYGNKLLSRIKIAQKLGYNKDSIAIPHQTHSSNVLFIDSSGRFENCDGLITKNQNVILSAQTADCIPVFLYDASTGLRGLVHAGWRGIVNGIIANALTIMFKNDSSAKNIQIFMGPSICKKCFEVGPEVAAKFDHSCLIKTEHNKYFIDLYKQVRLQLFENEIKNNNIYFSNICTFETHECASYRRDRKNAGRMYSFWGLKNGLY